ncbi:hypothetical protein JR316_0006095 [Psilocybe cubensis]|uniref:Uncharacterized protein n=1 Tax=Psilocybe cubensis TaxID=181762 RepID=A0ACB8H0Y9_PSICU|nr:hypothetical protein JR316_0006095 [Psilocybe cubensis]KAH9481568.1 hypothetical protein JR316_0006095 [Psilocybe cubensis]
MRCEDYNGARAALRNGRLARVGKNSVAIGVLDSPLPTGKWQEIISNSITKVEFIPRRADAGCIEPFTGWKPTSIIKLNDEFTGKRLKTIYDCMCIHYMQMLCYLEATAKAMIWKPAENLSYAILSTEAASMDFLSGRIIRDRLSLQFVKLTSWVET